MLNSDHAFTLEEISSRSRVLRAMARREVNALLSLGLAKPKTITSIGSRGAKKRTNGFMLNKDFQYLSQIRDLIVDPSIILSEDIVEKFKPAGRIKLLVVSGVFIGNSESRADILIVGDKLKKNVIQQVIKTLEADIGKELDYVVFDTKEFAYRLDMYDKLVLDILEFPHEKLVNTNPGLSTVVSKQY